MEHSSWEGLFPIYPGGSTMQLVTYANHLAGIDLMVLLGGGGICVLLWGRIVPRYLCPVFCVINLTMVHGDYGKIHAGNSEGFRFSVDYFPR